MAARDINNRQSLERWLHGRPIEDAGVIAARAVLYAIPGLEKLSRRLSKADWAPRVFLSVFRSCAVVRSATAYPYRAAKVTLAAYDAGRSPPHHDQAAAETAIQATSAITSQLANFTSLAVGAASRAAAAAANGASDPDGVRDIWKALSADAERLEAGISPAALAAIPLWLGKPPQWATQQWREIQTELRARSVEHWDVWIDWYNARLNGVAGDQDEEIARVLEVNLSEWHDGPAIANKKLKDVVARFRNGPRTGAAEYSSGASAETIKSTTRVFISHATHAEGAYASTLVRHLEEIGLRCWIAPRDIPSGADWNATIMSAIDTCDTMILLVSEAAPKSQFVKAEVQHAFERAKRVLPIRLAGSPEPGQIDLRLKIVQHIDGRGEPQTVAEGVLRALS